MARTKSFDRDEALAGAVACFWNHGYEGTSLDALMHDMNVARQSLYDTFGDKRTLYIEALRRYRNDTQRALRAAFANDRPVRDAFRDVLAGLCGETRESLQRGCLMLSASLERSADDAELAELLRENQAGVERIFRNALERAKVRGELAADKDVAALARFFVATIQGMRAVGRVHPSRSVLESIAATALQVLD